MDKRLMAAFRKQIRRAIAQIKTSVEARVEIGRVIVGLQVENANTILETLDSQTIGQQGDRMTTTDSTTTPVRARSTVPAMVGRRRGRPTMSQTVERYELPSRFTDLAKRRTENIAAAWGRWGDYSLKMLCASCYIQGIEDANTAIEANTALSLKPDSKETK